MPKRTRQEKMLTQLRHLQEQQKNADKPSIVLTKESQSSFKLESLNQSQSSEKVVEENYLYVTSDLRKTAVFAVLALAFEIILSVALAKGSIFG